MRISKGQPVFGYRDSFATNESLAPIIAAGLRNHLKVIKESSLAGYPFSVIEDLGFDVDHTTSEQSEQCTKHWHSIIEHMIWSFEQTVSESERPRFDFLKPISKMDEADREAFFDHHNRYVIPYCNKVQEGIDLFSKYFNDLWW